MLRRMRCVDANLLALLLRSEHMTANATPLLTEGWKLNYDPDVEWYPTDEKHPAHAYVSQVYASLAIELSSLPPEVWQVGIPVLYVDDAEGKVLRYVDMEPRLQRTIPGDPSAPLSATSKVFLVQRPKAATLLEAGDFVGAMKAAIPATSPLHANLFLKAREALETEAAMNAFEMLFQHYSFNEELWRLEKLMGILPFDLEEHPRMEKFRQLLDKQVGHLRDGSGRMTEAAISKWYSNGSPIAGVDVTYAVSAKYSLPPRFKWLIDECRAHKYKQVAEYGSVEGISLFHLIQHAPDIEWHGYESSDVAVKRGNELAKEAKLDANFYLHPMGNFSDFGLFHAVALFELLEHNTFQSGMTLVHRCMQSIRPGGSLFITTPHGNWSAFDLHTRDLELPKDHINSFTPARMLKFLNDCIRMLDQDSRDWTVAEVRSVENPTLNENNRWVFARLERST